MKENLRLALLAVAALAGIAPAMAVAQRGPALGPQAHSAASPAGAEPCEPSAQPRSPAASGDCRSHGVIRPPVTGDRGVVKPPDATQSMPMPVIPPPGSPGGSQSVRPK
jgi:hypothetical protein